MLRCDACGAALPPMFPGARVTCACGAAAEAPALSSAGPPVPPTSAGPYRASPRVSREPEPVPCPYCAAPTPPMSRVCASCDVRLDRVRCGRCFHLQPPGAFDCGRCGAALELEVVLDPLDLVCPRCARPLEGPGSVDEHAECARCGGLFVTRATLEAILAAAEIGGALPDEERRPTRPLDEVRYLSCPSCRKTMNRTNFGRVSGVIVDVCKMHGTWFDAGELTRVVEFVSRGGMNKARARAEAERQAEVKERSAARLEGVTHYGVRDDTLYAADGWASVIASLFS